MKQVGKMKLYSFEELLDEDYGKVGTPERDAFEQSVDEAVQVYKINNQAGKINTTAYPEATFKVITPENMWEFVK